MTKGTEGGCGWVMDVREGVAEEILVEGEGTGALVPNNSASA